MWSGPAAIHGSGGSVLVAGPLTVLRPANPGWAIGGLAVGVAWTGAANVDAPDAPGVEPPVAPAGAVDGRRRSSVVAGRTGPVALAASAKLTVPRDPTDVSLPPLAAFAPKPDSARGGAADAGAMDAPTSNTTAMVEAAMRR